MYSSKISSNLLFHFTKDIDALISILQNGFWPMTAIEDRSFMMPRYEEARVGIPMVCFTDIPMELIDEHRKEYGLFGLGMKKEWGIKNGLNPVSYILKDSGMFKAYNHLQWIAQQNTLELENGNAGFKTFKMLDTVMNYTGYIKLYSNDMTFDSKPFYDEREWRYLPPFIDEGAKMDGYCNWLISDRVDDEKEKEKLNEHMRKKYTLKFTLDDVEKIVLPDDGSTSKLFYELGGSGMLVKDKILILKLGN